MKHIVTAALIISALAANAAEKVAVKDYSFAEKTLPKYNDGKFVKLTDGYINQDGKRNPNAVVWCDKDNNSKRPVLKFNFTSPAALSSAKVHYFRGPKSYGLKTIKLTGITAAGERLQLGSVTLNQPYEKPASDPMNMTAEIESTDKTTPVVSAEISFTTSGSYVGLSEVEFFTDSAVKQ